MTGTLEEIETAVVGRPIVVNPSSAFDLLMQFIRYVGFAGSFFVSMVGFASSRDLAGLFNYLQSEAIVPALTAIAGLGFIIWAVIRLLLNKRKLVTVANAVPDSVAIVTGERK